MCHGTPGTPRDDRPDFEIYFCMLNDDFFCVYFVYFFKIYRPPKVQVEQHDDLFVFVYHLQVFLILYSLSG